ncbi:MAG: glucose-1-phosphate thymidylyltransferase [Candidatus Omnitrophota bacterium]|jgi:glucose-1-phosphate thymidylyltransferase|nr:MAG: glucose-1-phosphate thymidylyltransferase [Candidatus Omnitrophota bacterium]
MKAIIPCAGRGERLRPLTFTNAKPLIPIANKPLVLYAIEAIRKVGIEEIGLVVGENAKDLESMLGDGEKFGVRLAYIKQDEPKGIAHTIAVSKHFLQDSPFLMYLGDNLLQHGLDPLLHQFQDQKADAVLLLKKTEKPHLFGIAIIRDDRVIRLIEKPKQPPSDLACIGVYAFNARIHPIIDRLQPSGRGELEITDAIQGLIDSGARVEHHIVEGWWIDAGNPDDMIEANRLVLQDLETDIHADIDTESDIRGNVVIGKNTRIERSTIRGPVIIGDHCLIQDTFVGSFTSIGAGTVLENCEVEYSVIMENCEIRNVEVRIDNSILGRNVYVNRTNRRPKSYKLVLSDDSIAELR